MYLHKDREMFKDMVEQTAEQSGRTPLSLIHISEPTRP